VIERYHLQGLRKAESEVESDEVVESGEVVWDERDEIED
jgi:hypothetical protein